MKVVVGASSFAADSQSAIRLLQEKGIAVVKNPFGRKMTQGEIIAHLQGADGLLAGLEPLNETVFSSCPQLKAIARIGVGMDNVDIEAAKRYGIKVSNTPEAPAEAVAEMTLAALLTIAHRIIVSNMEVHQGIWKKRMGFSVCGAKVFLIGYGRIGRRFAQFMRELGAKIAVYDQYDPSSSTCALEAGLAWADVISLHASGSQLILSERELRLCKSDVVILNSARGALIDEESLFALLKDRPDTWYWGDVFWQEPYQGKLCTCSNAILTPHSATYTTRCREEMETAAVKNLLGALDCV